eukprot:TRINITY_DN1154_c0_g1_i13.p1 TRINITY_DN1154_c0_g1~~TRINITY_DN1154_c0_g1_i13.p1  ORF type:complete len:278 (+),score=-17.42 TRINITY_DN1154_c0_g1_i13:2-835(+)
MCRVGDSFRVYIVFFFSSRRRHTRFLPVSWARRCVQETGICLSINNIIIAAAKTGVIKANIRIVKNKAMLMKGSRTLRQRRPGIAKVRLVIRRLVNDMVVVTPAKMTDTIAASILPQAVNLTALENGGIKVHPAIVKVLLLHLVKQIFRRLFPVTLVAKYHMDSGFLQTACHKVAFSGINEYQLKFVQFIIFLYSHGIKCSALPSNLNELPKGCTTPRGLFFLRALSAKGRQKVTFSQQCQKVGRIKAVFAIKIKATGDNQKPILFNLGNATSLEPT